MSLLIKGGDVVDGFGNSPKKNDVLLIGGKIAAIGDLASYKADEVILAPGSFVCPGFIDISSTSDTNLSLFKEPKQADFLKDGVTTIICGSKGESLAPIMYADQAPPANICWTTVSEYLNAVASIKPGINFATFAGYGSIRKSIVSKPRNIGQKEVSVLSHLLSQCLDEGAIGISVSDKGFAEFDASEEEISAVVDIVKKSKKALFASLITEAKVSKQADEVIHFAENEVKVIIGELNKNLKSVLAFNKLAEAIESKAPKAEFSFAVFPFPYYQFEASELFPSSIDLKNKKTVIESLEKKRVLSLFSKKASELDAENTFVWNMPANKKASFIIGRSIADFAKNRGIKPAEALMRMIDIAGIDISFITKISNDSIIEKLIAHPKSIVGSSMWSPASSLSDIHYKLSSPFTEFIKRSDYLGLSIESTIKKLCAPAHILNLGKTGLIKEGYSADITIIKDGVPEKTIIKGGLSAKKEKLTENRKGKVIRK